MAMKMCSMQLLRNVLRVALDSRFSCCSWKVRCGCRDCTPIVYSHFHNWHYTFSKSYVLYAQLSKAQEASWLNPQEKKDSIYDPLKKATCNTLFGAFTSTKGTKLITLPNAIVQTTMPPTLCDIVLNMASIFVFAFFTVSFTMLLSLLHLKNSRISL